MAVRLSIGGRPSADAVGADQRSYAPAVGLALLVLFLAYLSVFVLTGEADVGASARTALVNAASVGLTGVPSYLLLRRLYGRPRGPVLAASHVVLAPAYSAGLYLALIGLLAFADHRSGEPFRVQPFSGPALPWQLMQGLMVYAVLAALAFASRTQPIRLQRSGEGETEAERGLALSRYLVKHGDGLSPVDVSEVLTVTGADDYCEVLTPRGAHLAHITLAEFERRAGSGFVRVHRSRIINFNRLARVELVMGGRMVVHMQGGSTVTTSRAGAQALRRRLI